MIGGRAERFGQESAQLRRFGLPDLMLVREHATVGSAWEGGAVAPER